MRPFSYFISPERHHKRRSGNWIVNDHAAQTINALDQFSSDNLLRRSLSNNFPFPQCNQMAGVTTGLIKIVQHRRRYSLSRGSVRLTVPVDQSDD